MNSQSRYRYSLVRRPSASIAGLAAACLLASGMVATQAVGGAATASAATGYALPDDEFAEAPDSFFATRVLDGLKVKAAEFMVPQPQFNENYTFVMLGFGDSFGSGEGAPDGDIAYNEYEGEASTDILTRSQHLKNFTGGTIRNWTDNTCHMSTHSGLYQHVGNLRQDANVVGANFACTGAESQHIIGSNYYACLVRAHLSEGRRNGMCAQAATDALNDLVEGGYGPKAGWGGADSVSSGSVRVKDFNNRRVIIPSVRPPLKTEDDEHRKAFEEYRDDKNGLEACNSDTTDSEVTFRAWTEDQVPGLEKACGRDRSGILIDDNDGTDDDWYLSRDEDGSYQSQLWYADQWLKALRAEEARRGREVVILGSYVSAGGNDKGFGPAFAEAVDDDWVDCEVASCSGLDDKELENSLKDFPSISWQLEATYLLLDEYMRQWNDSVFVADSSGAQTTTADALFEPYIVVQGYPRNAVTNKDGELCDDEDPDNDSAGRIAVVQDLEDMESRFLEDQLVTPLMNDLQRGVDGAAAKGVDIHLVETYFSETPGRPDHFNGVCVHDGPPDSEMDDEYSETEWATLTGPGGDLVKKRFANNDIDAEDHQGRDMFGTWELGLFGINTSKGAFHPNYWGYKQIFFNGKATVEALAKERIALFPAKGNDGWTASMRCGEMNGETETKDPASDISMNMLSTQAIEQLIIDGHEFTGTMGVGGQVLQGDLAMASTKDQFPVGDALAVEHRMNAGGQWTGLPLVVNPLDVGPSSWRTSSIRYTGEFEGDNWTDTDFDIRLTTKVFDTSPEWDVAAIERVVRMVERNETAGEPFFPGAYLREDSIPSLRLVASGSPEDPEQWNPPKDRRSPRNPSPFISQEFGKPLDADHDDFWGSQKVNLIVLDSCQYPDRGAVVAIVSMTPIPRILVPNATLIGGVRWETLPALSQALFDRAPDLLQLPSSASNRITTKHLWFLDYGRNPRGANLTAAYNTGSERSQVEAWPTLLPLRSVLQAEGISTAFAPNRALKLNGSDSWRWKTWMLESGSFGDCSATPDFSRLASGAYAQRAEVTSNGTYKLQYDGDPRNDSDLSFAAPASSCLEGTATEFATAVSFQCDKQTMSAVERNRVYRFDPYEGWFGRQASLNGVRNYCDIKGLFR